MGQMLCKGYDVGAVRCGMELEGEAAAPVRRQFAQDTLVAAAPPAEVDASVGEQKPVAETLEKEAAPAEEKVEEKKEEVASEEKAAPAEENKEEVAKSEKEAAPAPA